MTDLFSIWQEKNPTYYGSWVVCPWTPYLLVLSLSQRVITPSGSNIPPAGANCSLSRILICGSLQDFYSVSNTLPLIGSYFVLVSAACTWGQACTFFLAWMTTIPLPSPYPVLLFPLPSKQNPRQRLVSKSFVWKWSHGAKIRDQGNWTGREEKLIQWCIIKLSIPKGNWCSVLIGYSFKCLRTVCLGNKRGKHLSIVFFLLLVKAGHASINSKR